MNGWIFVFWLLMILALWGIAALVGGVIGVSTGLVFLILFLWSCS